MTSGRLQRPHSRKRSWFAASIVLAALACAFVVLPSEADDPVKSTPHHWGFVSGFDAKDGKTQNFRYNGCLECHDKELSLEPPNAGEDVEFHMDFDQYTTWRNEDRHSRAHQVVVQGAGKLITERLGYSEQDVKQKCFTCHAPLALEPRARFANPDATGETEMRSQKNLVERGVGCEVCHGPASSSENGEKISWIAAHAVETWRAKTPEDKLAMGMLDMRHPVTLAERCTTCHIGRAASDSNQSWVVNHDMYLAGHPPLPAIELATYGESEPNHWRWLKDKGKADDQSINDAILGALAESLGVSESQRPNWIKYEKSMISVVSAAVNLREAMLLVGNQAAGQGAWPELAQFDCYACHHELAANSPRQEIGHYEGPPGRVPYPHWQTTLAELAIEAIDNPQERQKLASDFAKARWEFRQAFLTRPFGDSPAIQAKARVLATWADGLVKRFEAQVASQPRDAEAGEAALPTTKRTNAKVLNDEAAKRILNRICAIVAERRDSDFDSSRQLAWMFKIVAKDLKLDLDPQARSILDSLDQSLALTIMPKDQAQKREDEAKHGNSEGWNPELSPYNYETHQRMKALSNFDPQVFRQCFADLCRLIP